MGAFKIHYRELQHNIIVLTLLCSSWKLRCVTEYTELVKRGRCSSTGKGMFINDVIT